MSRSRFRIFTRIRFTSSLLILNSDRVTEETNSKSDPPPTDFWTPKTQNPNSTSRRVAEGRDSGQETVGRGRCSPPTPDQQPHSLGLSGFLVETLRFCGLEGCPVLDRHGGAVVSSVARREPHGAGALLAVGDAASSANLLGGEGIRHAFDSADQLAEVLIEHGMAHGMTVSETVRSQYNKKQHQRWGWRWEVAGRLARRTWFGLNDDRADQRLSRIINGLSNSASAEVLSELLFGYQFERYGLRLLPYLI